MISRTIRRIRHRILDRFVLRPSRHEIDYSPKSRIVFDGPLGDMECFRWRWQADDVDDATGDPPDLMVLKFIGTGGRAENASPFPGDVLGNIRSEILSWNPPGYGKSSGKARLATMSDFALECFDRYMESRIDWSESPNPPQIWVTGNSLGCVSAMRVAAERPNVAALILRNPPPLVNVVKREARRYPLGQLTDPVAESLPDPMNLLVTAPKVNRPAVLIQSGDDDLVPPELQQKVIDAYAGNIELVRLEGQPHNGLPNDEQLAEIAKAVQQLWKNE